jgi:DNA mismatch repair protein MutS2
MQVINGESLEFDSIRLLLTHCAETPLGKALAEAVEPTADLDEIRAELSVLAAVRRLRQEGITFEFPDFRSITAESLTLRSTRNILEGTELYTLATALRECAAWHQTISAAAEDHPTLGELATALDAPDWIAKDVLASIDAEGTILDAASPELARLRAQLRKTRAGISIVLRRFFDEASFPGYVQDDFITVRDGRLVIPIKIENRSKHQGIVHDRSRGGDSLFFEPIEAVELNNNMATLQGEIRIEEAKILARLTAGFYAYWDEVAGAFRALARLDFIAAKALFAELCNGVEPDLVKDGPYAIHAARHPLLDERLADLRRAAGLSFEQGPRAVVPVDLLLGEKWRVLIVTGPNAGGKTVALKTAGLLAMMAQAAMHVPASDFRGPVITTLSADIGDAQDIISHLSSFSSHLTWLRRTAEKITFPALVLIDEIAAATDPGEGSAIAMATLEYLRDRGALVMASTHLEALKAFAHAQDDMENCSVEFNPRTRKPTYHLCYGLPGASNALVTAREVNLPAELLERAAYYLGDEGEKSSEIIARLQEEMDGMRRSRREAEEEKKRLEEAGAEFTRQTAEVAERSRQEVLRIQKEWREFRREQERTLHDALEAARQAESKQKAKEIIVAASKERDASFQELELNRIETPESKRDEAPLAEGDQVELMGFGQIGVVAKAWNVGDGGPVLLEVKGKRLTLPRNGVTKVSGPAKKEFSGGIEVRTVGDRAVRTEINLIGMVVEEAMLEVERFIDEALVNRLTRVRIIHGRGTGALRRAVEEYLKQQSFVSAWHAAEAAAGGDAVTVVELAG